MSTFPLHFFFLLAGRVTNVRVPEGQGFNLYLFLVNSHFLVGERECGGTLAFSLLKDFVYVAEGLCRVSSAHSN